MTWVTVELEKVLELCDSGEWGNEPTGSNELLVITTAHVKADGRILYETAKRRTLPGSKIVSKSLKTGDILVVKSSGSGTSVISGRAVRVDRNVEEGVYGFANFLLRLRTNEQICSSKFLIHVLRSDPVRQQVLQIVGATTYPNLSVPRYRQIKIPLPPLDEQHRIVRILNEAEALRQLRARADARMAEFIPALFNQMFGDPATNPKGWPVVLLGDVTSIDSAMVDPRETEYLDLLHIGGDKIESNTGELLPANTAREDMLISSKFLFDEHDVLYCKIRPYLRKVALPTGRGLCSADIYPVRPHDGKMTREYLWTLLLSEAFTKYTEGLSKRANMPKINREQLGAYSTMLPPFALQLEFAARVADARALQDQQARSRVRLEEGFQAS